MCDWNEELPTSVDPKEEETLVRLAAEGDREAREKLAKISDF